jgi:hypothetical protein
VIKMEINIKGHTITMGQRYCQEMYRPGGMICSVSPWGSSGCPITLKICICPDGDILVRSWNWDGGDNPYLHVDVIFEDYIDVTPEMRDTVSGLFSGRIKIEGIKIAVGASVQKICPIDMEVEEAKIGKKIFFA